MVAGARTPRPEVAAAERAGGSAVDVSLIVVTHNSAELIERCLVAVRESVRTHTSEVLVVDNASKDATLERVATAAPDATVVALPRNSGFAAANNVALARARGRYVALVNSDAFPDPGSVDLLIGRAEESGRIGLVGGRLRDGRDRPQPSAGRFPSLLGDLGVALFLHRLPPFSRLALSVYADESHYARPQRVDWVSGAFCLARREVGQLPAAAFMYGEDVEWARQANALGFETWLEPRAGAVHLGGGGVASADAARFRQRSRADFALRWFAPSGGWATVPVRLVMALHALVRLALFAVALPVRPRRAQAGMSEFAALLRCALRTPHRSG
jgi:N-acetylglucosaminyl-diphospho-decaprenol L-rhamnosyltransferase